MKKHRSNTKLIKVNSFTWLESNLDIPDDVVIQRFIARQSKAKDQIKNLSKDHKKLNFFNKENYCL